jgi:serine/threonine protein kinase
MLAKQEGKNKVEQYKQNQAVQLFTGSINDIDLRKYDTWYCTTTLSYLTHLLPSHPDVFRYIFTNDAINQEQSYYKQLVGLCHLSQALERCIYFIAPESPIAANHFIFGIIVNNKILIINPVGLSKHTDFWLNEEIIEKIKKLGKITDIFHSKLKLQKDINGLFSCGPVCAELMRHISNLSLADILKLFDKLQQDADIKPILSTSLLEIIDIDAKALYQDKIINLRKSHLEMLKGFSNDTIEIQNDILERCLGCSAQTIIFDLPSISLDMEDYLYRIQIEIKNKPEYKDFWLKKDYLTSIEQGNVPQIEELVKQEPLLLNILTFKGYTPLMLAIEKNKEKIVEILLEHDPSLDAGMTLYTDVEDFAHNIGRASIESLIQNKKLAKPDTKNQTTSDVDLAWQLQAKEYKYYQRQISLSLSSITFRTYKFIDTTGNMAQFSVKETPGDRDCFFHAVNKKHLLNRKTLVDKLITESSQEWMRCVFAHEIRQFLYLGYSGVNIDEKEDFACQALLTDDIKSLFLQLNKVEQSLRQEIIKARAYLGEAQTNEKSKEELLNLLNQQNSALADIFSLAYNAVSDIDNAIYQYCCQAEVFKNYVSLYLRDAYGYIPFTRELGAELPDTTIDVINKLFGLNIQVYLCSHKQDNQLKLVNKMEPGECIPILHNGVNHFLTLEIFEINNLDLSKPSLVVTTEDLHFVPILTINQIANENKCATLQATSKRGHTPFKKDKDQVAINLSINNPKSISQTSGVKRFNTQTTNNTKKQLLKDNISYDDLVFARDTQSNAIKLGKGSFAKVYKGSYLDKVVAIKKLKKGLLNAKNIKDFEKEIKALQAASSPNIVRLYGTCIKDSIAYMVMEYLDGRSLRSFLTSKTIEELTWPFRVQIATDMIEGLYYLHHKSILHRDIKSDNVLISNEGRAKLADLGLACQSNNISASIAIIKSSSLDSAGSTEVGTVCWMAPEILAAEDVPFYSDKSDIYAYAITLWEMASHKIPFLGAGLMQIYRTISKGERPQPINIPLEYAYYQSIMEDSWQQNPTMRPSARKIKELFEAKLQWYKINELIQKNDLPEISKHYFINDKALLNIRGSDNETVLHLAAMLGKYEVIELFLNKQPGLISLKDKQGKTALEYANCVNNKDIIKLLEFSTIKHRIEIGEQFIANTGNEEATLIIGKTGAGKSTLATYVTNQENLQVVRHKDPKKRFGRGDLVVEIKDTEIASPKIGHTKDSETTIPSKWKSSNGEVYWDCPGFADTNGALQDIPNAFFIKKIFNMVSKIKLVLVVDINDLESARATNIKELVDTLGDLFNETELATIIKALSLVVTKVKKDTDIDDILGKLEDILKSECFKVNSKGKELLLSLLLHKLDKESFAQVITEYILEDGAIKLRLESNIGDKNKIALFKRAEIEGDVLAVLGDNKCILEVIENTEYIDKHQINISISNESKEFIMEFKSIIERNIQKNIKVLIDKLKDNYNIKFSELKAKRKFKILQQLQYRLVNLLQSITTSNWGNIGLNLMDFEQQLRQEPRMINLNNYDFIANLINDFQRLNFCKIIKEDLDLPAINSLFDNLLDLRDSILRYVYCPEEKILKIQDKLITEEIINTGINKYLDTQESINAIEIYAEKLVLSDNLSHHKLKGINLSIIARDWIVTRELSIDLSGIEGAPYANKAIDGDMVVGSDADGFGKKGDKGADGRPGLPGGFGGNFFGAGDNFIGAKKLTINVSGGLGGPGQDGGNGSNGSESNLHGSKKLLQKRNTSTIKEIYVIGKKNIKLRQIHESKIKLNKQDKDHEVGPGGIGGEPGKGGKGGLGGLSGKVHIIGTTKYKTLINKGQIGANGKPGKPGEGGYSGKIRIGEYINEPFSGQHTKDLLIWFGDLSAFYFTVFPAGIQEGVKMGKKSVEDFKDNRFLTGLLRLFGSSLLTPLSAIGTVTLGPVLGTAYAALGLVGITIGAPITLGRDLYSVYDNSGWQGKFQKIKRQAESGLIPKELNSTDIKSPESSYLEFKKWIQDKHIVKSYHSFLGFSRLKNNTFIDKINSYLESLINNHLTVYISEDLDQASMSTMASIIDEENILPTDISIEPNCTLPTLNAFNQRYNSVYPYQINDIKMLQEHIQKMYINKIRILNPCGKDECVDRLIELAMSVECTVPVLCLLQHANYNSLPIWIVMSIIKQNDKLFILYDNNSIEKEIREKMQEMASKEQTNMFEYVSIHFNNAHHLPAAVDGAVVALDNMSIIANELATNCTDYINFINNFNEYSGLFRLDKIKELRESIFAEEYFNVVYTLTTIQAQARQAAIKFSKNHKSEIDVIVEKLQSLNIEGVHIKILDYYDILDASKQQLKTAEGTYDISQTILVKTNIERIKSNKNYSYNYILAWTQDLDLEGNIKFSQIEALFEDKNFVLEEFSYMKIIKIIPKNNKALCPRQSIPEIRATKLYKILNIEDNISLQDETKVLTDTYLHNLAKRKLFIYGDEENEQDKLMQCLIKGDLAIEETNLIFTKRPNAHIVEWINKESKSNNDFEDKVIKLADELLSKSKMELIKGNYSNQALPGNKSAVRSKRCEEPFLAQMAYSIPEQEMSLSNELTESEQDLSSDADYDNSPFTNDEYVPLVLFSKGVNLNNQNPINNYYVSNGKNTINGLLLDVPTDAAETETSDSKITDQGVTTNLSAKNSLF